MILNKRNASTILTIIGGAGVVVTTVMAINATPKATSILEKEREKKGEDLTKIEKIKYAGPVYIPTVVSGVCTVACIFGANILSKRQQASLMSAYALVDNSFTEYRSKLKELYGEEAHNNIVDSIAVEKAREVGINAECLLVNSTLTSDESCGDPVLFYDEFSNRYFESTIEQVITAEYHLNRNFVLRGYTVLNELYDFLGIELTDYGSTVGWTVEDELYWIDFNHRKVKLDDDLEVYILEAPWGPTADYLDYY